MNQKIIEIAILHVTHTTVKGRAILEKKIHVNNKLNHIIYQPKSEYYRSSTNMYD
jgi:hypothetical protein